MPAYSAQEAELGRSLTAEPEATCACAVLGAGPTIDTTRTALPAAPLPRASRVGSPGERKQWGHLGAPGP